MEETELQNSISDLITGLTTPFTKSGKINHEALTENARELSSHEVSAFFVCSNVSEFHSLTNEERIKVTSTSVEALGSDITTLAGVGGSVNTAIELAKAYESIGVDIILVMPPQHTYKHEIGLLEYYRQIGNAVERPIVPYIRNIDPRAEFIGEITYLESVIGIKWALPDPAKFISAVTAGSDDVVWINGLGEMYSISLYNEGAGGMASGIGNFDPDFGRALYDALETGDESKAREVRNATVPFMQLREESGRNNEFPVANSIPAVKAGLDFAGMTGGSVRPPLVELSSEDRSRARDAFRTLQKFKATEL